MTSPSPKPPSPTFRELFLPVWRNRRIVLLVSVVVALVTLGVNFLLPVYYKASAIILPDTDKNKIGLSNQLAGLASLAGVSVGGGDIAKLYPVIITSDTVLLAVIERKYRTQRFGDSVDLVRYLDPGEKTREKNLDKALKELKGLLTVGFDNKTSVVNISLEMREPQLAADVLNAIIGELDLLLQEKKNSSASEQRRWIEDRLVQVEKELREAEEALKDFRERNRRVTDSPDLLLKQERLMREVQVKGTIDVELRKQAEIAKIEEIKQVTTINVLDEGRPPVKKERPKRATNTAIAFVLALCCVGGYYATREVYGERIRSLLDELRRKN
jgi:uncharacterized protein involved in exopolysaccharide biosynthesis